MKTTDRTEQPRPGDSDPSGDELLHRVRNPRTPQPRTLTSYQPRARRAMADFLKQ